MLLEPKPAKQSAGSSHQAAQLDAWIAPMLCQASRKRVDVSQPSGKPINLDALAADVIVPLVIKRDPVAWLACVSSWPGDESCTSLELPTRPSNRILRHANVAVTQRLLHQDRGLRSRGGDAAIWAISRICT